MTVRLNPYLSFRDTAREAMEFYRSVFGGTLQVTTFAEGGMPHDPSEAERVMHSMLEADNGFVLMGADTPSSMELTPGNNYAVSLSGDDYATLRGYWDKLVGGGEVTMELNQAPWGDHFGMCVDQFGASWMVNITGTPTS